MQKSWYFFLLCCPWVRSEFCRSFCSWLCFSDSRRSLVLCAPGSSTVVGGSGCCLGSLERTAAANPTGLYKKRGGTGRAPCQWLVHCSRALAAWQTDCLGCTERGQLMRWGEGEQWGLKNWKLFGSCLLFFKITIFFHSYLVHLYECKKSMGMKQTWGEIKWV